MSTLIFNTKHGNLEGIWGFECNLPKMLWFYQGKSAFNSFKMHNKYVIVC